MEKYRLTENQEPLITAAVAKLQQPGTVLLVPTETVYGLVCDWQDKSAVARIYNLKQRDRGKPLALFVDSERMLIENGFTLPQTAKKLINAFCPGPLTIVVTTSSGKTFGFRIPDHHLLLALLKRYQRPLLSTSANASGSPNALSVNEALAMLHGAPDLVIDGGGLSKDAAASTVVLVKTDNTVDIIRSGPISAAAITEQLRTE